jgi:FlaG/FlaF family flagellin (archaellin)
MVAITVILSAVIATFVLGVGESTNTEAPQTGFNFEFNSSNGVVTVVHVSGENINGDKLRFAGAALEKTTFGGITEWSGGDVVAGDAATVNVKGGETLQLVWQSKDGETTALLGEYTVAEGSSASGSITGITINTTGTSKVSIGSLSQIQTNSAYLKLLDQNGNKIGEKTNVGSGSTQDITSSVGDGDIVTAELYESTSEVNRIDSRTKGTEIVSISNADDMNNNGNDLDIEASGENVGTDVGIEVIGDNGDNEAIDATFAVNSGTQDVQVDNSDISEGESLDVIIYESSAKNNKLDEVTITA